MSTLATSPRSTRSTRSAPTQAPAARRRRPPLLRLAVARTHVELLQFFRERDAVVFIFAYPVIMLAIFGAVFGQDGATVGPEPGIPFTQYFLPGMVATGVLLTSFQNMAITVAVERDEGTLKRLRGTPLPPAAYFLGKVGTVLLTSLVQMGLLLGVAAVLFDVTLPSSPDRWWTFAWVFALGTATGTVAGVAFSSAPRSGRSASAVVTPVVIVLQFVSGVFFTFPSLPAWMQQVAALFPLKWMAQGMRSVFLPDAAAAWEPAGTWEHGMIALVLAVYLVGALALGVRTFRWRRRDDG